jgi:hypothetical protein
MTNYYQIGDQVRLYANFTDVSCVPADPSSIFLRVVVGSADDQFTYPTTTAIVKSGVGSYYHDLDIASPGQHHIYWRGYGSVRAAEYHTLHVNTPQTPFTGS